MMDATLHPRPLRGRGGAIIENAAGRPRSRNKHWSSTDSRPQSGSSTPNPTNHTDGEKWERGGHRGGGRGSGRGSRKFPNVSLRVNSTKGDVTTSNEQNIQSGEEGGGSVISDSGPANEPELETAEERDKFYQELVKAREVERKKAILEGKMDDPLVPKRLEDAISIVGTCMDMCPRFERYRRERENNLFEWETIPGTKRVDHQRAVKMYERAAGDKTLPSDLRPPNVLKRTLDYLFHDLLPRGGFSQTFNFIRDRSRAVRNDFTMQHITGPLAIECHDRCARFHILALHFERDRKGFSIALEEQQLMNTLQSLKEFYEDQRGRYESPNELEMRVYHRLIHIRDQRERHEDIPEHITSHPVFKLTTDFRLHVQRNSAPISKTSALVVGAGGMEIFGKLATVLRDQGSVVMIYLVACILERLFGKETIDDIESLRGGLTIPEIIDGVSSSADGEAEDEYDGEDEEMHHFDDELENDMLEENDMTMPHNGIAGLQSSSGTQPTTSAFGSTGIQTLPNNSAFSAFSSLTSTPNVFNLPSAFGTPAFTTAPKDHAIDSSQSVFKPSSSVSSVFSSQPPATLLLSNAPPLIQESQPSNVMSNGNDSHSLPTSSTPNKISLGQKGSEPSFSTPIFSQPSLNGQTKHEPPKSLFGSFPSPFKINFESPGTTTDSTKATDPENKLALWPQLNPQAPSFTPSTPSQTSEETPKVTPPLHKAGHNINTSVPAFTFTPPSVVTPTSGNILPLKINTNTTNDEPLPASPLEPPVLSRKQPISLPSTPTTSFGSSSSLMLNHLKTNLTRTNTEILSPLFIPSPSASGLSLVNNFSPSGTPSSKRPRIDSSSPSLVNVTNGNAKGKMKAPEQPTLVTDSPLEMKEKASEFAKKGTIVRDCFQRWKTRVTDKAAWIEACKHSEAYRQKLLGDSSNQLRIRGSTSEKKRRVSTGPTSSSNPQKRPRRRISSNYQLPRTDEELARRLKENHEAHERRWAQGSFLQVIKTHLDHKYHIRKTTPWHIWLSMNPDSDATAIWLERKFDVPASGQWIAEAVFSMPASVTEEPTTPSPGIIVFECTPLENVPDDIERKYRILDDTSRLRDIIKSLPPKRHFVPSLLVIIWTEKESSPTPTSDFFDMVKKLVEDSTIQSFTILAMSSTTQDFDEKLKEALASLELDVEGKLVESLSIRGIFKNFEHAFRTFILEWLENCSTNSYLDWFLYSHIVQVTINSLDSMANYVMRLAEIDGVSKLPAFPATRFEDCDSIYAAVAEWLEHTRTDSYTQDIYLDLQSHRNLGQEFPSRMFIDHLYELTMSRIEQRVGGKMKSRIYVPVTALKSTVASFDTDLRSLRPKLVQALNLSIRRSPKRRNYSLDTDATSPEAKRMRLSASIAGSTVDAEEERTPPGSPQRNGRNTPSPSNSVVSAVPSLSQSTVSVTTAESSVITVAMLRALTQDMKRKYASQVS